MTIKLKGLSDEEVKQIVPDGTIFLGYRGSIAHGTYVPQDDPNSIDDKDLIGVAIGDLGVYFGLSKFEQKEVKYKEWDSVVYEIRKMFRLLLKSNPNVLSTLFLPEDKIIYKHEAWENVLKHRDYFISKQAYHSFSGYAKGQLHRMTHGACEGYMGEKRKKLVQEFGYDTKNASHLIRLLRMSIEFLTEGVLYVNRKDSNELIDIKKGRWTLEAVKKEADVLFEQAREAYIHSKLPDKPYKDLAEDLLIKVIRYDWFCT